MKTILRFILLFSFVGYSQVGFEEKTIIDKTFGYAPSDMEVGDMDGDNYKDVVVVGMGVHWLKNLNSQGKFSRLKTIAPNSATTLNIADLNGDTFLDVIFSDSSNGNVYWCKNTNGAGVFDAPALIALGNSQFYYFRKIETIDYDNDNDMDVVINMKVFYNSGVGVFTAPNSLSVGSINTCHFANFNNIGSKDYVYMSNTDSYNLIVGIMGLNNTLTSAQTIDSFAQSKGFTSGDIDGDNDLDIINLYNNGGFVREIYCYKNDGSGTFGLKQPLFSYTGSTSTTVNYDEQTIEIKDLDNDGLNDIIVNATALEKATWYKNLGSDQFSAQKVISTSPEFVYKIVVADLDNDGFQDIITADQSGKICWLKNNAGLTFGSENIMNTQSRSPDRVDGADLDNDGDTDLVSVGGAKVSYYKNTDGAGNFANAKVIYFKNRLEILENCQIKDMDGDGKKDVVFYSRISSSPAVAKIIWLKNDGAGNFISENIITTNAEDIASIIATDIDNDNDIDIICHSWQNKLSLYKNNGNGVFANQQMFSVGVVGYGSNLRVNDMDGDGDQDVFLYEDSGNAVWYENSNGQGLMTTKTILASNNVDFSNFVFSDLDGDNLKDIVYTSTGGNQIGWYKKLAGQSGYAPKIVLATITSPYSAITSDIDGDGDQDIVFNASQVGMKYGLIQNSGLGVFGAPTLISNNDSSLQLTSINSFEINGDGKKDVVYTDRNNDKISWFKNLGPYTNQISGTVTLDLDANGCTINDPKAGQILVSTQNGTTTSGTFTQPNGTYNFYVGANQYTTTITSPLVNYGVNPISHIVNFTSLNNVSLANFCLSANQVFDDLDISLITVNQARPGFTAKYQIVLKNKGTNPLSGTFKLNFNNFKINFTSSTDVPTSQAAGLLNFSFATLLPFQTKTIDLKFLVNTIPTVNIGDILLFNATINNSSADVTPNDNIFVLNQTIVGSFDPNDITCVEGNQIAIADADKFLHYVIRFQNTGTAHAQRVYITNDLDTKLDWNTLQLESSSHGNTIEIKNGNQIKFVFDGIYLPAQIQNDALSNGFIAYKIKPKSNVVVGNVFNNQAKIYFDFNPAIITNVASTTIVSVLNVPIFLDSDVQIYPVPTDNELFIKSKTEISKVLLYNEIGQLIYKSDVNKASIDFSVYQKGFYFLKITDINNQTITKKVIKN